jgi:hypothetical protein
MITKDYTVALTVTASAEKVFNSINNIAGWWTVVVEGASNKLHDVFTVRFGETFITIRIIELLPYQKISWQVIDNYKHWLTGNKKEWQDTVMHWEIAAGQEGTAINFTHVGLVPGIECYDGCENAWNFYIKESLFKLLTTGQGTPELK